MNQAFKDVMANYPTGVTVVTALDENNNPAGLTVNSFASVSISPLLILWSIGKGSSSYETMTKANKFAVNILAENQADICSIFATKGEERFQKCEWTMTKNRLPEIKGSAGVIECETYQLVDAGDHTILIGKVLEVRDYKKQPLLYHNRKIGAIPKEFY